MKLCLLTTSYPLYEGHLAGHFVKALAVRLAARGHAVRVLAPNDGVSPVSREEQGVETIRFDYMPRGAQKQLVYGNGILPNLRRSLRARLELPAFLTALVGASRAAARGVDLCHAHWSLSAIGLARWRSAARPPLVVSVRGSDLSDAGGKAVTALSRWILKGADGVVAESEALRARAALFTAPSTPLTVLGNGVELATFAADHDRRVWRGTGAEKHAFLFLFVGRLSEVKGPDRALRAFSQIADACPDAGLVFVGDGPLRRDLESGVASDPKLQGRVHFVGSVPVSDVPGFYRGADALVLSSRHEGTPNVVLEALAADLPVVCVPVGGIPDLAQAGAPLAVAAENEPLALANGMKDLYEEAHGGTRRVRAGRAWAELHLNWERIVDAYEEFYRRTLEA